MNNTLDYKLLPELSSKRKAEWLYFYKKNKRKIEASDLKIHDFHAFYTSKTDCLTCGNCCRTLGPRLLDKDIERMAKSLRMKTTDFISKYIKTDEDDDLVFNAMPCPFLGDDNYCAVYENRPRACREYPHTDRKKFSQIYLLSVKNAETCPIVFQVLDEIIKM